MLTTAIPDQVPSYREDDSEERNRTTVAIVGLILRSGNRIKISEKDFLKALKMNHGHQVVKLFLEHNKTFQPTEPILIAAIRGLYRADTLQLLLQQAGDLGVTEAMFAETYPGSSIMKILCKHRDTLAVTQMFQPT